MSGTQEPLFTDEWRTKSTPSTQKRENIAREDVSSFESLVDRFYLSARRWIQDNKHDTQHPFFFHEAYFKSESGFRGCGNNTQTEAINRVGTRRGYSIPCVLGQSFFFSRIALLSRRPLSSDMCLCLCARCEWRFQFVFESLSLHRMIDGRSQLNSRLSTAVLYRFRKIEFIVWQLSSIVKSFD